MKHFTTPLLLLVAGPACAQLTNGGFEANGAFSLTGWEWTCSTPQPQTDVPVGGGEWSAWKEPGNAKGCFPSWLYQRVPEPAFGIPLQLSAWAKCPQDEFQPCLGATIGLGTLNNGTITPWATTVSNDPNWAFITVGQVFDPGVGDTVVALLGAGFIGGPANPLPAGFDEVTLSSIQSVAEHNVPRLSVYPDPASDVLNVGTTARLLALELYEATGRKVSSRPASGTTTSMDVSSLATGQYIVRAITVAGVGTTRFIKR